MYEKNLESSVCVSFGRVPYFLFFNNMRKKNYYLDNTALAPRGVAGIRAAQVIADHGVKALPTLRSGENAKKLDADIPDIDYLIISNGHNNHGGGLFAFLRENKKAEVFLHRFGFVKHYALRPNDEFDFFESDEHLKQNRQIVPKSNRFFISEGIHVFSNIPQRKPLTFSNRSFYM